jgi:hypothetical protein
MTLQQLESFLFPLFTQYPVLAADSTLPALYALADQNKVVRADVDRARADFALQQALAKAASTMASIAAAASAPSDASATPKLDVDAVVRRETTGCLGTLLIAYGKGRIRPAMEGDTSGNVLCALLAEYAYLHGNQLAMAVDNDANGIVAGLLAKDPTGRGDGWDFGQFSLNPSAFPAPADISRARVAAGFDKA